MRQTPSTEAKRSDIVDGSANARPDLSAHSCENCGVRSLGVCVALGETEQKRLKAIATTKQYGAQETIFSAEDPVSVIGTVVRGAVKTYKLLPDGRQQVIGFLFPGDFLGLANDQIYAYSAEAVTFSTLCRFPRTKLEPLLERYPQMERRLLSMASHELAVAQEQMLLLGRKTAREKVASFLVMLSRRAEQRGQPGNPVSVPMSRNDIGDFLGLTTETVSRTFTQLKSNGTITLLANGKVELANRRSLQDISEGS